LVFFSLLAARFSLPFPAFGAKLQANQTPMATAFALLKVNPKRITQTAEALLNISAVSDVYSISGKHDLLVVIKCEQVDRIEFVITDELLKIEGVLESETMFAFRSYDKREGGRAIDVD